MVRTTDRQPPPGCIEPCCRKGSGEPQDAAPPSYCPFWGPLFSWCEPRLEAPCVVPTHLRERRDRDEIQRNLRGVEEVGVSVAAFAALSNMISPPTPSEQSQFGPPARSESVQLGAVTSESELLRRAATGDGRAWSALVDRYQRLVWSVVRGFRLDEASAADVYQTVWQRLVEHCDRIEQPERLAGWLATTARNESLRVLRKSRRQIPSDFAFDVPDLTVSDMAERMVDDEARRAVLAAFRQLDRDSQRLLALVCAEDKLDYQTIASMLGRPIGSIGPTRQRALEKLRVLMERELDGGVPQ